MTRHFLPWKEFVPVTVNSKTHSVTFYVSPDYLQLGDEQKFLATSSVLLRQEAHGSMRILIPTVKMVNIIYQRAQLKIWSKTMSSGRR